MTFYGSECLECGAFVEAMARPQCYRCAIADVVYNDGTNAAGMTLALLLGNQAGALA